MSVKSQVEAAVTIKSRNLIEFVLASTSFSNPFQLLMSQSCLRINIAFYLENSFVVTNWPFTRENPALETYQMQLIIKVVGCQNTLEITFVSCCGRLYTMHFIAWFKDIASTIIRFIHLWFLV